MIIILWLGVIATWGTVLKGHSIRKVENDCPGASAKPSGASSEPANLAQCHCSFK